MTIHPATIHAAKPGDWIRRFHPTPLAATRLICFPHAGGSAAFYLPFSRALSPAVDVLAVQYPGRQDRLVEARVDDVHQMADQVLDSLDRWLDRPVTLFGHSLGASVAFEVAVRLAARGTPPTALFASGREAPSRPQGGRVHLAGDDRLVAELAAMGGTDEIMLRDKDLLQLILPAFRSDYRAAETYRWRHSLPLPCPIHVLTGREDPGLSVEEVTHWRAHTVAEFELSVFPGGHFFLADNIAAIARLITQCQRRPQDSGNHHASITRQPVMASSDFS